MQEIPLIKVPNQQLMITLNGQDCTFHVYQRGERLYMDMALDGDYLVYGAVCLPGINVGGEPYPFEGYILFTDELSDPDKQTPPQYDQLGTRYHMYFATEAELQEMIEESSDE